MFTCVVLLRRVLSFEWRRGALNCWWHNKNQFIVLILLQWTHRAIVAQVQCERVSQIESNSRWSVWESPGVSAIGGIVWTSRFSSRLEWLEIYQRTQTLLKENTTAGKIIRWFVRPYSIRVHFRSGVCGGFPADDLSLAANRASLSLVAWNALRNGFRSEAQTWSCGQSDWSSLKHDSRLRSDTNRYWRHTQETERDDDDDEEANR